MMAYKFDGLFLVSPGMFELWKFFICMVRQKSFLGM